MPPKLVIPTTPKEKAKALSTEKLQELASKFGFANYEEYKAHLHTKRSKLNFSQLTKSNENSIAEKVDSSKLKEPNAFIGDELGTSLLPKTPEQLSAEIDHLPTHKNSRKRKLSDSIKQRNGYFAGIIEDEKKEELDSELTNRRFF